MLNPCQHNFHRICIEKWFNEARQTFFSITGARQTCPVCFEDVDMVENNEGKPSTLGKKSKQLSAENVKMPPMTYGEMARKFREKFQPTNSEVFRIQDAEKDRIPHDSNQVTELRRAQKLIQQLKMQCIQIEYECTKNLLEEKKTGNEELIKTLKLLSNNNPNPGLELKLDEYAAKVFKSIDNLDRQYNKKKAVLRSFEVSSKKCNLLFDTR